MKANKIVFLLLFFLILALTFLVLKPFLTTILASVVLAFVLRPVYKQIASRIKYKHIAAAITIFIFIVVVALPLIYMAGQLTKESYTVFLRARQTFNQFTPQDCTNLTGVYCTVQSLFGGIGLNSIDPAKLIEESFALITTTVLQFTSNIVVSLPSIGFHLFILIFVLYFALIDAEKARDGLLIHLPISKQNFSTIEKKMSDLIYATIYGTVFVGIIQGLLAVIGFFLFGVTAPLFWGLMTLLASFIPFVGSALIWIPVWLSTVAIALSSGNQMLLLKSIGLLIWCVVLVSSIDNVLKPKIIGTRANLHPVFVLLGVFGGLQLFGAVGIIVGPLVLSLFIVALEIWDKEKHFLD